MNWIRIIPFVGFILSMAGNALSSWSQNRKMGELIKAEVEKQSGKSK
jgi:hypothetical protein